MINKENDIVKCTSSDVNVITLRKDNILTLIPHEDSIRTNIDTIKIELEILIEWTKSTGPLPFLVDVRYMKQLSTEERVYIQKKVPLIASKYAVIIKAGLSTFFFNLMAHLNSPTIEMKAFSDPEKALNWLKNEL